MAKKNAISPSRAEDFPAWFQAVVKEAEVAELAHVRGSMVIRPWGYATWELMQRGLDGAIKEMITVKKPVLFDCLVERHENCLPMIPSGKPHNEMILPDFTDDIGNVIDAKGRELV